MNIQLEINFSRPLRSRRKDAKPAYYLCDLAPLRENKEGVEYVC